MVPAATSVSNSNLASNFHYAVGWQTEVKLVLSESRAHPEIGRFYLENVIGKALPMLQSLIERGIASGEFRAVDPRLTVKCLIGPMLLGALWKSVFQPIGAEPLDIEALARQHADFIVRALQP